MANEMQRGNLTGTAIMRMPISGTVSIGGKQMKELRFMPYSEFPETGREETLYIDTDGNVLYYYDGTSYVALSGGGGGGSGDYNELSNKPRINGNVLTGNKTAANLGLQETISDIDTIRSGAASGSTAVQPETLATALATKQDVISDIASIRSGASKGDTAVQPSDMESALSEKQDAISDLQTIRSGAALGTTAVQPETLETALSDKQDVINDLDDIRSGASAGATAVKPDDMETALADKQDVINDLDTIRSGATAGNTALQPRDVDTLPTDGSSNPVSSGGTYNFVNSSIATNTAYFIGTFASVAELEAYTGTVTNNDYAFVTSTDSAGNTLYNRYKYNAATQTWSFEYAVNNTAFTAAQWAAIQSGMTSADKTKLDGIEQGANKTVIDAAPTSGSSNAVSSSGVHTALSGKQDTIADLSDIRSGAAAGATALQQSDVSSTYSATDTAPVNGTAVNAAIETLDVSSVGGSGKYISEISETNGKISPTSTTFDTALSSSSTNNNAPTSKAVYEDQQRQDELEAEDRAALIKQVDEGAKNLSSVSSGIISNSGGGFPIPSTPITVPIGTYIVSFKFSGNATRGSVQFRSGSTTIDSLDFDMAPLVSVQIEITSDTIDNFNLYSNSTATISEFMICTAADWAVSQKFVPYCPTNRDLYETKITMVDVFGLGKALTSGDDMDGLSLGHFACTNATIAGTVSHAPWSDGGFFGWTMTSIQTDRFVQIAIKNSDDFQIAKRRYYGTWSNWVYSITTPAST